MSLLIAGIAVSAVVAAGSWRSSAQEVQPSKKLPPVSRLPEWTDSMFLQPYVDVDEWRSVPVRHRYVHGGFTGTETRFSIYFPPPEQYEGRFFQSVAAQSGNEYAVQQQAVQTTTPMTQENTTIGFAVASGAYHVETNNGSIQTLAQSQDPNVNTVIGYRANAAAAQYSRVLAAKMYGPHRPYGYLYGGSGASLKTVCGFENTNNVWDGILPYIYGTMTSMPNAFTAAAHAHRLLKDKWRDVVDALDPGGSGDMYATLNQEQRDALREATRMGVPPRTWFAYNRLGFGPIANHMTIYARLDPDYFTDFWKVPGYLGANPPESLKRARIQQKTVITRIVMSDEAIKMGLPVPQLARGEGGKAIVPAAIRVRDLPKGDLKGAGLFMKTGGAAGHVFYVASTRDDLLSLAVENNLGQYFRTIKVGDELDIDNSNFLALQTYHRHQVPTPDFYVFNQFRKSDGTPMYPQRPRLLGPDMIRGNGGCAIHTSWVRFPGKVIMVETLVDEYAHPWQADYFRSRVKDMMGARADDVFRLYFVDNAMHGAPGPGPDRTRIVQFTTVLQQGLRDLSAWVEKGIAPPPGTAYKVADGQIEVPAAAAERKGVQPVVTLKANGGVRAEVAAGQPVTFVGAIDVPPNTGKVVEAAWDFEGRGDYPIAGQIKQTDAAGARATVTTTYAFSMPGTYFPALRAASQRQADGTPYARIQNLARVRVVVK